MQLRNAESPLILAGKLLLLMDDANWISGELRELTEQANPKELTAPLLRDLVGHEAFLNRINVHKMQVRTLSLNGFWSELVQKTISNNLHASAVLMMLGDHASALKLRGGQLVEPYLKAIRS